MVRLVLFDIDGTLIHTNRAGVAAFARAFASEFGVHNGTERIKFAGRTDVSLVREMFAISGIEPAAENFHRFFDSYTFWLDHLLAETTGHVCDGVQPFIRELDNFSEPPLVGLLTGNIKLGAEIKLRHFNLWENFRMGAFADDHEDRDQIAAVARQRGSRLLKQDLRGDQILVIGDTPLDIRCARAIGAKILAVATGGSPLKELKNHQPDWLVEDLRKIDAAAVCS